MNSHRRISEHCWPFARWIGKKITWSGNSPHRLTVIVSFGDVSVLTLNNQIRRVNIDASELRLTSIRHRSASDRCLIIDVYPNPFAISLDGEMPARIQASNAWRIEGLRDLTCDQSWYNPGEVTLNRKWSLALVHVKRTYAPRILPMWSTNISRSLNRWPACVDVYIVVYSEHRSLQWCSRVLGSSILDRRGKLGRTH